MEYIFMFNKEEKSLISQKKKEAKCFHSLILIHCSKFKPESGKKYTYKINRRKINRLYLQADF
jgi:hypothetical protein